MNNLVFLEPKQYKVNTIPLNIKSNGRNLPGVRGHRAQTKANRD